VSRLSRLAPRVKVLRFKVDHAQGRAEVDRNRNRQAWRSWYSLKRWKELRLDVFERDLFTCQWPGCGRVVADTSKLVADHRTPHRGDPVLFWDDRNLWTLCEACHSGPKQREEARQGL
jgi:5-methylcytosine-specific restriction enzyme A